MTPSKVLPENRHVDCPCPPDFERPILREHVRINMRLAACLRCGAVSATESLIEEPRPFDVHCIGNQICDVSEAGMAWLAKWPRRTAYHLFLPATLRVQSADALAAAEANAEATQAGADLAERLRRAGFPRAAPPELPEWLRPFVELHDALALPPDATIATLVTHMDRAHEGGRIASDLFARRPGWETEIAGLLSSRDPQAQRAAHAFVQARRILTPLFTDILTAQIKAAAGTEDGLGILLGTIFMLGPAAKPLAPVLRSKARWIWRDSSLRRRVRQIADGL